VHPLRCLSGNSDKKVQQASVLDLQKWLEEPQFAGHDDVTSKAALAKFADHHFGHVTMYV